MKDIIHILSAKAGIQNTALFDPSGNMHIQKSKLLPIYKVWWKPGVWLRDQNSNIFEHAENFSSMEPASISLKVIKIHNQLWGEKLKKDTKEKENKVSWATYPQDKHLTRKNEIYICMQKHLGSQECLVNALGMARRGVTRGRSTPNPTSSSFKYQERDIRSQTGRKGAGKEDTGWGCRRPRLSDSRWLVLSYHMSGTSEK